MLSIVALTLTTAIACGDVYEYQAVKLRLYEQTSPTPPGSPSLYIFDSYIDMDSGDATIADVDGNPMTESFPGEWELIGEYATQIELDTAAPGPSFSLNLSGGALGTRSETLTLTLPEIYPAAPVITPASFTAAQDADPSADLLLEWNAPDTNTNFVFLSVYDVESDTDIFDADLPVSQTSYLIPASQLLPDHTYEIELAFANAVFGNGNASPGFGTSSVSVSGYASLTILSFTTSSGAATIPDAGVLKAELYVQDTADTQPTVPVEWAMEAFIDTEIDGLAQGELQGGAFSPPFFEYSPGEWDIDDNAVFFNSKSALDFNFPSNQSYTMHIEGGTLGTRDQPFSIGPDAYPVPGFLTGTVFDDLQNMDPTVPFDLSWTTPPAGVDLVLIAIDIQSTLDKVYEIALPSNTTQHALPADLLSHGESYQMLLTYVDADIFHGNGSPQFEPSMNLASGYITDTVINFTTGSAACNADMNGDDSLDFFDVSAFLIAFGNQNPIADFQPDGSFDFFDVSAFLIAFGAGCP